MDSPIIAFSDDLLGASFLYNLCEVQGRPLMVSFTGIVPHSIIPKPHVDFYPSHSLQGRILLWLHFCYASGFEICKYTPIKFK